MVIVPPDECEEDDVVAKATPVRAQSDRGCDGNDAAAEQTDCMRGSVGGQKGRTRDPTAVTCGQTDVTQKETDKARDPTDAKRDPTDAKRDPIDVSRDQTDVTRDSVTEPSDLTRPCRSKSSLRRRNKGHAPLSRKISFPPEELFQSSVNDGDNTELHRVLRLHGHELDLDKANHAGVTALHQAVLNKNLDAIKLLLFHGCRVDVADAHGFTALHTASACGHLSIASFLILHGADIFAPTHSGDLAADLAKDSGMARVLQDEMLLQLHGQYQQQQRSRGGVISAVRMGVMWIVALCLWIWQLLTQPLLGTHTKHTQRRL